MSPDARHSAVTSCATTDLHSFHQVQSRLMRHRTETTDDIDAILLASGISAGPDLQATRMVLVKLLMAGNAPLSAPIAELLNGLYEDWLWLDERIDTMSGAIRRLSARPAHGGPATDRP